MKRVYVAGQMFPAGNGKYEFKLIGPTGNAPYVTENPDSSAMRFCGMNGSALYFVNFSEGLLVDMEDPRYGRSTDLSDARPYGERCPKIVLLSKELAAEIRNALESGKTVLTE